MNETLQKIGLNSNINLCCLIKGDLMYWLCLYYFKLFAILQKKCFHNPSCNTACGKNCTHITCPTGHPPLTIKVTFFERNKKLGGYNGGNYLKKMKEK